MLFGSLVLQIFRIDKDLVLATAARFIHSVLGVGDQVFRFVFTIWQGNAHAGTEL